MDEKRLLLFRWGSEEFGVPVEDVTGVVRGMKINGPAQKGAQGAMQEDGAILALDSRAGLEAGEEKTAIILHVKGIQMALIVDEAIREEKLPQSVVRKLTKASFAIWKMRQHPEKNVQP